MKSKIFLYKVCLLKDLLETARIVLVLAKERDYW